MSINTNLIDQLEDELGALAAQWREKHSVATIKKYHRVYKQMIQLGWDQSLDHQDHLPNEVMPQEYHNLRKERSNAQR